MKNKNIMYFDTFENKYIVKGTLELRSSTHMGSGYGNEFTDSLVLKDENKLPYISGSSLKGVIRSNAERIVAGIDKDYAVTCLLSEDEIKNIEKKSDKTAIKSCYTVKDKDKDSDNIKKLSSEEVKKDIEENLCTVCRVFGSKELASKVKISDAYIDDLNKNDNSVEKIKERWAENGEYLEIRDSICIDRDTGATKEKAKYDYEIIWKDIKFKFDMVIENVLDWELGLVFLGMIDLFNGEQYIGGKTSRGLGKCKLKIGSLKSVKKDSIFEKLKKCCIENKPIDEFDIYDNESKENNVDYSSFISSNIEKFINYADKGCSEVVENG